MPLKNITPYGCGSNSRARVTQVLVFGSNGSKIGAPNGTLVSRNMDQNLRSPGGFILTHTNLGTFYFEPPPQLLRFRPLAFAAAPGPAPSPQPPLSVPRPRSNQLTLNRGTLPSTWNLTAGVLAAAPLKGPW